jgi:hypothetical protein
MAEDLLFLAGHRAFAQIREHGLTADDVEMVIGASGAAKWLVLHGLETAIFCRWFSGRSRPLHLYGTSIGAWKSAAAARSNPEIGLNTLAHAYIQQFYHGKITPAQIAREADRIMDEFLPDDIPAEILRHPYCRLHISAVRCRGFLASEQHWIETAGLAVAWIVNRLSRKLFHRLVPPVLFHDPRILPPFSGCHDFTGGLVPLSTQNLRSALLASGSIPYAMRSVRDIHGAPAGSYRDGGLYHYHPAFDFLSGGKGIVLYPHFFDKATLGWFDKDTPSRQANGAQLADVLLLAPSPSFVASLPHGRIPDRLDFVRMAGRDDERIAFWEKTVSMSSRLGNEFLRATETGRIRDLVRRIT